MHIQNNDITAANSKNYKSYCSTVHFRRITSIYQPTIEHIISHKTLLKHSDMFRSCQIIIRELCSLLKLYYSIHNSIRICKRGVVAAYHVVWECVVEQWLGVRRTTGGWVGPRAGLDSRKISSPPGFDPGPSSP